MKKVLKGMMAAAAVTSFLMFAGCSSHDCCGKDGKCCKTACADCKDGVKCAKCKK